MSNTTTLEKLREAVTEIDSMSQGAFTEIATLARLSLKALESPHTYKDLESVAVVLSAILGKALDAENYINCIAGGVECNYTDEAERRRSDARRKSDV